MQQGPQGAYAYVIRSDSTVESRPIKVAQISDGQALIDSGLKANEQVVVDGQYKLQPGSACHDPARQGGRRGRRAERAAGADPMNISAPFIQRPIATALLMVGLLLGGLGRLSAVAGRGAAERQLSDASGHRAAAGRRSADHGVLGGNAARDCSSARSRASPR